MTDDPNKFDAIALLTETQRDRDSRWLLDGYRAAFDRIKAVEGLSDDEPPESWGLLYESKDDFSRPGVYIVTAWSGTEYTPEEARMRGFELLAHADIAEAQAVEEKGKTRRSNWQRHWL